MRDEAYQVEICRVAPIQCHYIFLLSDAFILSRWAAGSVFSATEISLDMLPYMRSQRGIQILNLGEKLCENHRCT